MFPQVNRVTGQIRQFDWRRAHAKLLERALGPGHAGLARRPRLALAAGPRGHTRAALVDLAGRLGS